MKTLNKLAIASIATFLCASLGFGQLDFSTSDLNSSDLGIQYIGGVTSGTWTNADVIANPLAGFEIEGFDVSESGGALTIDIYATEYFQKVINGTGLLNTVMGDLFISVDGLNWSTTADTFDDYFGSPTANETTWEYGISLAGDGSHLNTSGTGGLYQLDTLSGIGGNYGDQVLTSNETYGASFGGTYRQQQEVHINTRADTFLSTVSNAASWSILEDVDGLGTRDVLSITLNNFASRLGFAPGDDVLLGFHWTMSCANDVIEFDYSTSVPVPEPSTVGLLAAAGMAGLLFLRRRFIKK